MAACHKKVWDHFTKAQRKNIELWKKQSMEIKNVQLDETLTNNNNNERADDEMEVSDEDDPQPMRKRHKSDSDEKNYLKDENESLRCQMEAYKNEVEVLKIDYKKEVEDKEKQLKMMQQTLQGMQQQLIETKRKQCEEENKVKELQSKLQQSKSDLNKNQDIITLDDSENEQTECVATITTTSHDKSDRNTPISQQLNECDAKLIGIISAFLNVHPFGAGLDYIWSYVSKIESDLKPSDIETLMSRFPMVFKQELVGIGANIERKWIFNAFNAINKDSSA